MASPWKVYRIRIYSLDCVAARFAVIAGYLLKIHNRTRDNLFTKHFNHVKTFFGRQTLNPATRVFERLVVDRSNNALSENFFQGNAQLPVLSNDAHHLLSSFKRFLQHVVIGIIKCFFLSCHKKSCTELYYLHLGL